MNRLTLAAPLVLLLATTAACGSTVQTDPLDGGQVVAGQVAPGGSLGAPVPGTVPDATGALPDGGTIPDAGGLPGVDPGSDPGSVPGTDPGVTSPPLDGGETPTDTPADPTPSGPPIGNDEPIQVGFLSTAVSNAAALGIDSGSSYADTKMIAALVEEYNAAGGLAGHQIEPVIATTDTGASSWANEFQAACSTFTEDNQVDAVVGYQFIYYDAFEACMAKAGVAHFYGGYQPGDVADQQSYPTLVATGHPTVDGANLVVLTGALKRGLIGKGQKLGLLLDSCAHGDRAFKNSTEPWLKANKIPYEVALVQCAGGGGDAGSAAAAVSGAELRFASRGVDVVYAAGLAMFAFMTQAETQFYRPTYITGTAADAVASLSPREQVKKLHGFGWMPTLDVSLARQPYATTKPQQACLDKLAKQGLKPAKVNDFMSAYQVCDAFELYAKALAATGTTDSRAIVAEVVKRFPMGAGTYGGAMQAGAGQRGGPAKFRESAFNSSCNCLTYTGPTYPVPLP